MKRRFKLLGVMLTAMFSLFVAIVGSAQAGKFELLPGRVKFTLESAGRTLRQTLGGKKIECERVTGDGEPTAEDGRLGLLEFKFTGCTTKVLGLTVKCTGLEAGDKEGETLFKAEWHLRHLLNGTSHEPDHITLMILVGHIHFECAGVLFLLLGSICSDDLLTQSNGNFAENLLLTSVHFNFLAEGNNGDPVVTEVDTDSSLGMEKCELLTKEGTSETNKYESSVLGFEGLINPAGGTLLIELTGTF